MANAETTVLRRVWKRASEHGLRLFRNNVGLFLSQNGHPVRCGLHPGSGDLIGITPKVITDDMVGHTVGVFTSIEVKTTKGKPSKEQLHWQAQIISLGGIAKIINSEDQV